MRYELEEFDHLYSLYGDERIRKQMKIWSRFASGKYDKDLKFLLDPNYDFSREIPFDAQLKGFNYDCSKNFYSGLKELQLTKKNGVLKADIQQKTNFIQLSLTNGNVPKKLKIKAYSGDSEIKLSITQNDTALFFESIVPIDRIEIKGKKERITESKLLFYDYKSCVLPQFAWVTPCTPIYITKGQKIMLDSNLNNLTNAVVFYRRGSTADDLKKQVFRHTNSFVADGAGIVADETGVYEFFVSFDITHPMASMSECEIRVVE
jgi:hypothetical protein